MSERGWVLGIDLGTTNTAAVVYGPSKPGPISILYGRGSPVLPSIVSFKNPELPVVGWLAKDMTLTDPLTTIFGWKRFIGRSERSEFVSRYKDRFPFRILANYEGELGAFVHERVVTFVEIAALVLDQVRLQTHAMIGQDVRDCVISVPAHFASAQRDAVIEAGSRAGLNVLKLVNEPTAAALAYGVGRRTESRLLVFDFGGGTFDATVLEQVDNIFDVKATRGDGFLGGLDLDRAVTQRLVEVARQKNGIDLMAEPVVAQRVLGAAENGKCALSTQSHVRVHLPMIAHDARGRPCDLDYLLAREELEALTAPLVERTIGIAEETVRGAGLSKHDLDAVLLVGGQSRMPLVQKRITEAFGQAPRPDLDPFTAVAHGSALVARSLDDVAGAVLLDVLSVPIGIIFPGGRTQFLFESNRTLPAETSVDLAAPPHGQDLVVGVWQGPDIASTERHVLGVLRMPFNLFSDGRRFSLELRLTEDLDLKARFHSDVRTAPLRLEAARYG